MPNVRAARVTEVKRVPVEKAAGRQPTGGPPARVNPAPEVRPNTVQNSSKSESKS